MTQREISLTQLTATRASSAVVLIRFYVGLIFVGEGVLKFLREDPLGPGRFIKAGIPGGEALAYLDGVFEIGCGLLILAGLLTRLATIPMIVDMVGALTITKVPLLWGNAPLYPQEGSIGGLFHEGRREIGCFAPSFFPPIVGAASLSLDARFGPSEPAPTPAGAAA